MSHNIILFELDFGVKFPLLHFLQFPSDSKSTIILCRVLENAILCGLITYKSIKMFDTALLYNIY